jgi:hypothetical protein
VTASFCGEKRAEASSPGGRRQPGRRRRPGARPAEGSVNNDHPAARQHG